MARIKFPATRPAAGTPFTKKNGWPQWNDCDYEGWGNGSSVNERMQWVADPAGGPNAVAKLWVQSGDVADHWGGCRSEMWQEPHSANGLTLGQRAWCAFSLYLPSDFTTTSSWGLVWQIHTPVGSATLSPLVTLDTTGGKLSFRGVGDVPGGFNKGRWQAFVVEVLMGKGNGELKAWCGVGAPPDTSKPPTVQRLGWTTDPDDGDRVNWPKLGVYRDGSGGGFPTVAFYGGYGLSTNSMAEAVSDADFPAVFTSAPPPPQDTLPLTILSEDQNTITLGWTPPAGAVGYRFRKDGGKWSHTWDGSRSQVKFGKPYTRLEVEALAVSAKGDIP